MMIYFYISEIAVAIIAVIIALIILRKKTTKRFIIVVSIILVTLLIGEGVTFVLEKPEIEISKEDITLEAKIDKEVKKAKTTYHLQDMTD